MIPLLEILKKYAVKHAVAFSGAESNAIVEAMYEYASEEIEKYEELIKVYDELATTRNCMLMSPNLTFQSIEDRIEFNARCTIDEENLCKKIEQLKKELP